MSVPVFIVILTAIQRLTARRFRDRRRARRIGTRHAAFQVRRCQARQLSRRFPEHRREAPANI